MASGKRWDQLPPQFMERLRAGRKRNPELRKLANASRPRRYKNGPKLVSVSKQQVSLPKSPGDDVICTSPMDTWNLTAHNVASWDWHRQR